MWEKSLSHTTLVYKIKKKTRQRHARITTILWSWARHFPASKIGTEKSSNITPTRWLILVERMVWHIEHEKSFRTSGHDSLLSVSIWSLLTRVSQPVFRGAIFSVPQNNEKIKKQTSSNERNKKIFLVLSRY